MVTKKDLIIVISCIFCLASALFMMMPTRSSSSNGVYDPWIDSNDDGVIDSTDLGILGANWGTTGTPINKTALLLELQARIDSLNATNLELQSKVDLLNASLLESQNTIDELNATVLGLQSQIDTLNYTLTTRTNSLNATVASLLDRVSELEANYSVTNLELAPNAIPVNSTSISTLTQTTETMNWIDMSATNVNITLQRASHLLIMFSLEAQDVTDNNRILIQAVVNGTAVLPDSICLTPIVTETGFIGLSAHRHSLNYCVYTCNFYLPSTNAGTYNVQIKWRVTGGTGSALYRTLTVIALPA